MKLSFLFYSVSSFIVTNGEKSAQGYELAGVCAYYPKVHKTNALTEACDEYCANQPNFKTSGFDLGKRGVQANGDVSEVAWKEHRQDEERTPKTKHKSRLAKTEDYDTTSEANVNNVSYHNTLEIAYIYQRRVSFANRKEAEWPRYK